ncbi:class I SAM-dependent methyltransferase [Agrobacterium leguminum]|uniref:Class I SAM-dependent methyltransferase n=1 Tax=Agrobacterium leguminum TaxID=2792015 RepID=A0A9X3KE65_9HYPH|nr:MULTISPECIES: class I SAM-dependent methyltransferase [Agrobacterium]MCZ7909402.1 class I SAM-dependent methyltransferase [Agrobacterium leguminum]WFS67926.1 class I SAM-dependent methyltransferase [Agrobacterium leguminum]
MDRAHQINATKRYTEDDLDLLGRTFEETDLRAGTAWDMLKHSSMELPDWFKTNLDPFSDEYEAQQLRMWQAISGRGRNYDPEVDELEVIGPGVDAVRFPAFYVARHPGAVQNAGNHLIAMGSILQHSGLKAGDWALEYGAGFGQTALALSRLGVNVDTVDISKNFCGYVKENAEFFGTSLTPHVGTFADLPRGRDHFYDLIYFYKAFHHCLNFRHLIKTIKSVLRPKTGRIILCAEPIFADPTPAVPYPWGFRLDSETTSVTRSRGWLELGFDQKFIVNLFQSNGFKVRHIPCPQTMYGEIYVIEHRDDVVSLGNYWLAKKDAEGWYPPESEGRWTKQNATIPVDASRNFSALTVSLINHLPVQKVVSLRCGDETRSVTLQPSQIADVRFRNNGSRSVDVSVECHRPTEISSSPDTRPLGIFVSHIRYL